VFGKSLYLVSIGIESSKEKVAYRLLHSFFELPMLYANLNI